jgi:CTD kinase subunit gamma
MQFLTLISRLSSSLPSLSKVSSFALKHAQKCSDDIWDCLLDELSHSPSLNHRINMLYLVDLMLDKEGPTVRVNGSAGGGVVGMGSYRALVERDLAKVVDQVVPRESKQGVLNHMSAMQVTSRSPAVQSKKRVLIAAIGTGIKILETSKVVGRRNS